MDGISRELQGLVTKRDAYRRAADIGKMLLVKMTNYKDNDEKERRRKFDLVQIGQTEAEIERLDRRISELQSVMDRMGSQN